MCYDYQMEEMEILGRSFPHFDPALAIPILKFVRDNVCSIGAIRKLPELTVSYNPVHGHPIFIETAEGKRIIALHAPGNDELQLLYQFSHEYMHYYIAAVSGQKEVKCHWLEEALCCLSTLTHLLRYAEAYPQKGFRLGDLQGGVSKTGS